MTRRVRAMRRIVSLATLLIFALPAVQCVQLRSEDAFSAAAVRERLWPMLPALAVYAALIIAAKRMERGASERQIRRRRSERKDRRAYAVSVWIVCAAPCLVWLLNGEHFVSWDLEQVMGQLLLHTGPWIAVGFAAAAVFGAEPVAETQGRTVRAAGAARALLYAVAAAFIVLGAMNGGLRDVLVKAGNLCTECIGLG